MSPPMVHFVVCVAAPNAWAFLHSFARRRLKNWISVWDLITGSPGFFHVWVQYLDVLEVAFLAEKRWEA